MKINTTLKQALTAALIAGAWGAASCKKDKTNNNPQVVDTPLSSLSIDSLKLLSTAPTVKIPAGKKITGIVISDAGGKNIDAKTVILQQSGKGGVVVNFNEAQTFAPGDLVEVNVSGQNLIQAGGEIVVDNVPAANAQKTGTGIITARSTTAAEVLRNAAAWDGTLVALPLGVFDGNSGKYGGTITYSDNSATVASNVLTGAAFENMIYPSVADSVSGIVRVSGTVTRVDLRNAADVTSAGISRVLTEDFKNVVADDGSFTFTTASGTWNNSSSTTGPAAAFFTTPYFSDAFLQKTKVYPYIFFNSEFNSGNNINPQSFSLKGVKTVSVTFAGSNFVGTVPNGAGAIVYPFDSTTTKFGVTVFVYLNLWGAYVPVSFVSHNTPGTPYTYTFKVPATVQGYSDLLTALVNAHELNWDGVGAQDIQDAATDLVSHDLQVGIGNNSSYTKKADGSGYSVAIAPVVLDKITFGF